MNQILAETVDKLEEAAETLMTISQLRSIDGTDFSRYLALLSQSLKIDAHETMARKIYDGIIL